MPDPDQPPGHRKLGIEEKEKTISELALDVFQLFSNISFFIDSNLFLDLDNQSLLKLYSEIKDFYCENFTEEQKNNISNNVFVYRLLSVIQLNLSIIVVINYICFLYIINSDRKDPSP